MKLSVIADDDVVLHVLCEGEISEEDFIGDAEPMEPFLGSRGGFQRKVMLNLERATIIYTSGMSWLLRCNKRFNQDGGRLVLHSIPPMVEQSLKLVRLQLILHCAEDEASARALALKEPK